MSTVIKQGGLSISVERFTVKDAIAAMGRNKTNRHFRKGHCDDITRDMRNDAFIDCVDPIVFYENGDLADGQHRLQAIINSGKAQTFIVVRNYPPESALNLNTGRVRTVIDNLRIAMKQGVDVGIPADDAVLHPKLLSTAKGVELGHRGSGPGKLKGLSFDEQRALLAKHYEAARWAVIYGPRGRFIENAVLRSALARAWYHEQDKDRLAQFGKVVSNGYMAEPGDAAAVTIRNYFIGLGTGGVNSAPWSELFLKAQNALWYFMRRRPLSAIKRVEEERYPLKKSK